MIYTNLLVFEINRSLEIQSNGNEARKSAIRFKITCLYGFCGSYRGRLLDADIVGLMKLD